MEQQPPDEHDRDRFRRLVRRLGIIGPGPAAFYDDAVVLAFDESPLRMRRHFVGHAFREIESAVRDVLLPRDFVVPDRNGHVAEIHAICRSMGFAADDPAVSKWLSLAPRLHATAHRRDLALPGETPEWIRRFVFECESVLDPILERYEVQYQAVVPLLIELAGKLAPSQSDLQLLRKNLPNNLGALGLFFDRIASGAWLPLIASAGYFENAPPLEYDPDAGTLRAPRWPQAEYLARYPLYDPDLTIRIIRGVDVSGNFRVASNLLDALNGLTPDRAVEAVPNVIAWLDVPMVGMLDDKVVTLIERLRETGFLSEAVRLALALFDAELGDRSEN